jgi:hypothetical protein
LSVKEITLRDVVKAKFIRLSATGANSNLVKILTLEKLNLSSLFLRGLVKQFQISVAIFVTLYGKIIGIPCFAAGGDVLGFRNLSICKKMLMTIKVDIKVVQDTW